MNMNSISVTVLVIGGFSLSCILYLSIKDEIRKFQLQLQRERRENELFCPSIYNNTPSPSSTCWNWNKIDDVIKQKGCDNAACENAVCSCDPYCCEQSWDLSCRGYLHDSKEIMDNYFIPKCSASILCCEEESATNPNPVTYNNKKVSLQEYKNDLNFIVTLNQNDQYCENLQTNAPDIDSNCWDWTNPEFNYGSQKGCDHKACQDAVCACDPFCCSDSWDLSCRGWANDINGTIIDNPWVPGCSASKLCCEPDIPEPTLPPIPPQPVLPPNLSNKGKAGKRKNKSGKEKGDAIYSSKSGKGKSKGKKRNKGKKNNKGKKRRL